MLITNLVSCSERHTRMITSPDDGEAEGSPLPAQPHLLCDPRVRHSLHLRMHISRHFRFSIKFRRLRGKSE